MNAAVVRLDINLCGPIGMCLRIESMQIKASEECPPMRLLGVTVALMEVLTREWQLLNRSCTFATM